MSVFVHWPECTNAPCTCVERGSFLWTHEQVKARSGAGLPPLDCDTRDPAEEACYEFQKACWAFQTAIEQSETKGRIAFIAGMLDESRKRLGLVCVAATAKELELNS